MRWTGAWLLTHAGLTQLASRVFALHPPAPLRSAAAQYLESCSDPQVALAKALAKIAGVKALKPRSLLNADEGFVTLHFAADHEVASPGSVWGYLR